MGEASRRKWEARLERLRLSLQEKTETMHPVKYLRVTGIASLLLGGGLAVIFAFFWTGVGFIYLGAIILAADIYSQPWNWKWKLAVMLMPILIVLLVSIWISESAPLNIQMIRHYGNYKEDEVIGGITWKDQYSELLVLFSNLSSDDYHDFDAFIVTDLGVAGTGWIEGAPTCVMRIPGPHVTEVRVKGKDAAGNPTEQLMSRLALTGPYHLHCDKLLRHDTIQIVFALVNIGQPPEKPDVTKPESLLGPKKLATWSFVHGTYISLFRPFSFSERKELIGD